MSYFSKRKIFTHRVSSENAHSLDFIQACSPVFPNKKNALTYIFTQSDATTEERPKDPRALADITQV